MVQLPSKKGQHSFEPAVVGGLFVSVTKLIVTQDPLGTSAWNALISGRCLTRRIDRPMACLRRHQRGGRLQGPRRSHRIETYGKDASIETYVARSFPRKAALLLLLDVGLAWTGNIFDRQESYGCFSLPKHPPRS